MRAAHQNPPHPIRGRPPPARRSARVWLTSRLSGCRSPR
ncbi:hypothetical protein T261_1610 [Streptomyces lydicus]|nr:hypothetical protein T261_1610 [Streptomyces lydicus]